KENYLDLDEERELLLILNIGISCKTISADDINMVDGIIISIAGLNFDYKTRLISLKGSIKKSNPIPQAIPIDFTPVKQENYEFLHMQVLDYHRAKVGKAHTKGNMGTPLTQLQ